MSKPDDSAQSAPPTEREKDKQTHFDEIKSLKQEMDFLESVRKVTTDEPSRESLGRSIELLKGSQDRLYKSLYVKYGVTVEEADKIIGGKKPMADVLTGLRERVATYGVDAIAEFDNSGQFDAGVLRDLGNMAVNVQDVSEQAPQPLTEQEKIVENLLELSKQEKRIIQQISESRKSLNPEEIQVLEQAREQKRQEYKEKFAEVVKRSDGEQIIKLWENAVKLELKIKREAEAKELAKTPSRTK
jgi:hypothetical protein